MTESNLNDLLCCDDCGKSKDVDEEATCPFAEEMHGETIGCTLCADCYHERCMEI